MSVLKKWLEKWRAGIRLGETSLVLGLWTSALSSDDAIIAQLLLIFGLSVAGISVVAESCVVRKRKLTIVTLLLITFACFETVYLWRHRAATSSNKSPSIPLMLKQDRSTNFNNKGDSKTSSSKIKTESRLSYIIDVACEAPAPLAEAPKSYRVITVLGSDGLGMGTMSRSLASPPISMNKDHIGLLCTVSNLSDMPVYNLSIKRIGRVNKEVVTSYLRIQNLPGRPSQGIVFAIQQAGEYLGEVSFAGKPVANDIYGHPIGNIRLTSASNGPFYLTPHFDDLIDP